MSFQAFKTYFLYIQKKLPNQQLKINCHQRFQHRDLNILLANPCLVDDPAQTEEILQFKQIRASLGYNEKFVCQRCPMKSKCQYNAKFIKQKENFNSDHLTFYFQQLVSKERPQFNEQFWFSTIRVLDTYQAILDDSINHNAKVYSMLSKLIKKQTEENQIDLNRQEIGKERRKDSGNQVNEKSPTNSKDKEFKRRERDHSEGEKFDKREKKYENKKNTSEEKMYNGKRYKENDQENQNIGKFDKKLKYKRDIQNDVEEEENNSQKRNQDKKLNTSTTTQIDEKQLKQEKREKREKKKFKNKSQDIQKEEQDVKKQSTETKVDLQENKDKVVSQESQVNQDKQQQKQSESENTAHPKQQEAQSQSGKTENEQLNSKQSENEPKKQTKIVSEDMLLRKSQDVGGRKVKKSNFKFTKTI